MTTANNEAIPAGAPAEVPSAINESAVPEVSHSDLVARLIG